uniref:Golgi associated, gamma adaptin ear containing, ARF binding protein 2 n=1 Tax=Lepisosteus oculatus TaxID=7918 RepID=W5M8Y4_LEPOC
SFHQTNEDFFYMKKMLFRYFPSSKQWSVRDMAADEGGETLESWLNKATNPSNERERWDCIQGFYESINKELEGPQIALRLLAHKIQSPQEKEALQALTVLEACMNNCGKRFHNEAGKFRFLNELIKVLSPKYLGMCSAENVKSRVAEVLYGWTVWLPDEVKMKEAYHMLKKQGIIKKDPKLPDKIVMPPPAPRAQDSVFDDEDKSKLLEKLLTSKQPEDLQAANRLIKNTIKEKQEKMEKVSKRIATIEEVENNTKLLKQLLESYRRQQLSSSDRDTMKDLYEKCEKLRPTLFRLASDTVDNDEALAEILQANDKLTLAVNAYQELVVKKELNGNRLSEYSRVKEFLYQIFFSVDSLHGLDIMRTSLTLTLTVSQPLAIVSTIVIVLIGGVVHLSLAKAQGHSTKVPVTQEESSSLSLLDEEFMLLGLNDPPVPQTSQQIHTTNSTVLAKVGSSFYLLKICFCKCLFQPLKEDAFSFQEQCGRFYDKVEKRKPASMLTARGCNVDSAPRGQGDHRTKSLTSEAQHSNWSVLHPRIPENQPIVNSHPCPGGQLQDMSFSDIFISLDSIMPSNTPPLTAYDKNGLRVMLHFAKNTPVGRPDIVLILISMLSTSPYPVKDIVFQAAVPKTMRVKLQSATGSELPAYNPILPPAVISQVMLLSNPQRGKVRLRYKLNFTHGTQKMSELGEVENFPDLSSWAGM